MKRLLSSVIEIPERVHKGDFVLGLSQGVKDPAATLKDYVVTDQLVGCFDDALSFIRGSLETGNSKAAFLHGSFGSGKSHFMAVMHLLLSHNPDVRSVRELAPVISKHTAWLGGRKLLLVATHMIGAENLETPIFDAYVQTVTKRHPGTPLPGVYLTDRIFENAQAMRAQQGDELFFRVLSGNNAASGSGWGSLDAAWDKERFEEALSAPPKSSLRLQLVSDLVANVLTAYRDIAKVRGEGYVSLDEGLSIISRHAQSLGYDGVVLFLDELILWLASHVADMAFINREGPKLSKLVEATSADRPVPIISFVARQRDLRELVGAHIPGAEQLGFADVLKHWEDRFHRIHLEDKNLPDIVARRLLKPVSAEAAAELRAAFSQIVRMRDETLQTLLTTDAARGMFEKVYPFSPALLQTLVAVSSALQRTRTAIRLLLQLLVARRNDLALGEVVPVGDLWDVVADGDEPFMDAMRLSFERARKLYTQKLRPLLESTHGVRWDDLRNLPTDDPKRTAFRAEDRLLKTLLLAALVPEVESLRSLTANRLAALNYGSIQSTIPGREGRLILERIRSWSAQVGEIRVSEDRDPVIQLQLSGVDTDSILERAKIQDSTAQRRQLIKRLLFARLGVLEQDSLYIEHEVIWKGTSRRVEVVYANVRELTDESLRSRGDEWRVLIDFPFDEENHGPADDRAKVQSFLERGESAHTFVWLPRFFNRQTKQNLGTLVILDYLLTGERFVDHASHLSAVDRAAARAILESQKSQLEGTIGQALLEAYGIAGNTDRPNFVESSHSIDQTFVSLEPALSLTPPVAADLRAALEKIIGQLLSWQFPAHPDFEEEIKSSQIKKVCAEVLRATQVREGRIIVPKELRPLLRQIANPIKLGEMTDGDAFLLGQHWRQHFDRLYHQEETIKKGTVSGRRPLTVRMLRSYIDLPRKMGLLPELQNLIIVVFAAQTNRAFFQHGGPVEGKLGELHDELELREQDLPDEADWVQARHRAESVFGLTGVSELRNAVNVAELAQKLRDKVQAAREDANLLLPRLAEYYQALGIVEPAACRLQTARTALTLLESMTSGDAKEVVRALAKASLLPTPQAIGASVSQAKVVGAALGESRLQVICGTLHLADSRREAACAMLGTLKDALVRDELALPLAPVLSASERKAVSLLAPKATERPSLSPAKAAPQGSRSNVVAEGSRSGLSGEAIGAVLQEIAKASQGKGRRLSVSWSVEEDKE